MFGMNIKQEGIKIEGDLDLFAQLYAKARSATAPVVINTV